jgi:O-antigen ligase
MGRSDNPKRVRRSLATVVIILVGIFVSLVEFAPEGETAAIAQRFQTIWQDSSEQGNSNPARLVIISGAADVIAKSWGLGVGVGNLRFSLPAETGQYFNHAENTYLQALAEQGLLGFLGLIILSSYTIKRLVILKRQHTTDWLTEALLMWFVAIAVFQLFNNVLDNSWYWAVFALGVGYAGARERESRQPRIVLLLRSAPSLSPHIVAHTR